MFCSFLKTFNYLRRFIQINTILFEDCFRGEMSETELLEFSQSTLFLKCKLENMKQIVVFKLYKNTLNYLTLIKLHIFKEKFMNIYVKEK